MTLLADNHRMNVEEVRSGQSRLSSVPLQVNVELTGVCNINPPCLFCTGKNFGHNYRPLDATYLDKYAHFLERCDHVNEDSFGEPLSHPALVEVAQRFTANDQVFSFVTNGLLLSQSKADKLAACGSKLGMHVSFNAATEDTFFKLTGHSFARVIENVRYFVQTYRAQNDGNAPNLILTFIVMKINRHEVRDFLYLAHELGARALLAPLHDRPSVPLGQFGYDFIYEDEMLPYQELLEVGKTATALAAQLGLQCLLQWDAEQDSAIRGFSEAGVATPCLIPWRFLFIQEHTSKVFACPYHRNPYGDLTTSTLDEIWNGDTAQAMRRSLAQGDIPKYCFDHSAACPLVMAARHRGLQGDIEAHITMGENDIIHLSAGWYPLEYTPHPIRWTSQVSDFRIQLTDQSRLCVEAIVWGTHVAAQPVCGTIELAGQVLGHFNLTNNEWNLLIFVLPPTMLSQVAQGRISTERTWVPAEVGLGQDTRRLGMAVRRIWLE